MHHLTISIKTITFSHLERYIVFQTYHHAMSLKLKVKLQSKGKGHF